MSRVQTISFGVVITAVAGTCVGFGMWQIDRLSQRRTINRTSEEARSAPVVDLTGTHPGDLDQRRVRVEGRFDAGRSFVLRGRPYRGSPGVELVVPVQIAGSDTAVLVNLGFVPAADAFHFDPAIVDLPEVFVGTGLAMGITLDPGLGQPVLSQGDTTWRHIELSAVTNRLPYPFLPIVVGRSPGDSASGYPRALPAPPLDDGPHLSYAIQWFSFAIIALVGGAIWVRKQYT